MSVTIPPPPADPWAFIGEPTKTIVRKGSMTSIFTKEGTGVVVYDGRIEPGDVDPNDLFTLQVGAPKYTVAQLVIAEVDFWKADDGTESVRVRLSSGLTMCAFGCTVPRYATEIEKP